MPKTFNLNMTNTGFKFLDGNRATLVQVFEGDWVVFTTTSTEPQTVTVSNNALFNTATVQVPTRSSGITQVVTKSTEGPSASLHHNYDLSYTVIGQKYSLEVYVNVLSVGPDATDGPGTVTVCPNANIFFLNNSSQNGAEIDVLGGFNMTTKNAVFPSTLFANQSTKEVMLAGTPAKKVQVASTANGNQYTLGDNSPGETQGDTITIKVDPSAAGTGVVVGR